MLLLEVLNKDKLSILLSQELPQDSQELRTFIARAE